MQKSVRARIRSWRGGGLFRLILESPILFSGRQFPFTPRAEMILFFASLLRSFLHAFSSRRTILSENAVLTKENHVQGILQQMRNLVRQKERTAESARVPFSVDYSHYVMCEARLRIAPGGPYPLDSLLYKGVRRPQSSGHPGTPNNRSLVVQHPTDEAT